jgi:hypothetical protein
VQPGDIVIYKADPLLYGRMLLLEVTEDNRIRCEAIRADRATAPTRPRGVRRARARTPRPSEGDRMSPTPYPGQPDTTDPGEIVLLAITLAPPVLALLLTARLIRWAWHR